MRRKTAEITDQAEIQRILSRTNIGRMATIGRDGYPYITPVNFVFLNGNIYFHCAPEGEKLDNISENPSVCFEVDIPLSYLNCRQFYHCVIIRGRATTLEDDALRVAVLRALVSKHEMDPASVDENVATCKACAIVEIKPVSLTAKSGLAQNVSEEKRRAIAEDLFKRNRPLDRETVEAMGYLDELLQGI